MSIDVIIKQKGIFKKDLPIKVILGNNLSYGTFDGLRLKRGVIDGDEFIVYNSACISRGVSVIYKKSDPNKIILRLLNPTSNEELRDFYQCIGRISDYWKCELEVDGEKKTPSDFQRGFEEICEFNARILHEWSENICSGKSGNFTLFSAFWPLAIGKTEAELFMEKGVDTFRDWMHKKQSIDAYYAKPQFFASDDSVSGKYVITEDTLSIFPLKGHVPFGVVDTRTNKQLVCEDYKMCFCSITKNAIIGEMPYEQFFKCIDDKKIDRYDAEHVIIYPISLAEMEQILALAAKNVE